MILYIETEDGDLVPLGSGALYMTMHKGLRWQHGDQYLTVCSSVHGNECFEAIKTTLRSRDQLTDNTSYIVFSVPQWLEQKRRLEGA